MERKRPSPVGKIGWRTKGVGATIYVCVAHTTPLEIYCPLARCVLSLHVRLVLSKSPFVSSYSSSSKESPFQKCAKKAIREAWGSLTNKRINGSSLGGVSRVHSKELDSFSRERSGKN